MNAAKQTSVLVVDDDATTLQLIRAVLEDAGFDVRTRGEALGTAAEIVNQQPDFVLLDVNMPALPGDRIAQVLSSGDRLGHTRIIFYSSRTEQELSELSAAHGVAGWIKKGGDYATFVAEFRKIVQQHSPANGPLHR